MRYNNIHLPGDIVFGIDHKTIRYPYLLWQYFLQLGAKYSFNEVSNFSRMRYGSPNLGDCGCHSMLCS